MLVLVFSVLNSVSKALDGSTAAGTTIDPNGPVNQLKKYFSSTTSGKKTDIEAGTSSTGDDSSSSTGNAQWLSPQEFIRRRQAAGSAY